MNFQHKDLLVREIFGRNREVALNVLDSKNRLSCGYGSYQGYIDELSAALVEILIHDLDRPWLCRIPPDITILLKCFKMRVNGRGGFQIDCLTDISYRGRISAVHQFAFNKIQNFFLLCCDLTVCHRIDPPCMTCRQKCAYFVFYYVSVP